MPLPRARRRGIRDHLTGDLQTTLQELIEEGRQQQADCVRLRWQRDASLGVAVAVLVGCLATLLWLSGLPRPSPAAALQPETSADAATAIEPDGEGAARDDVARTVETWAAAWSAQDVETYLSFYAADFRLPGATSRQAWEAQRQRRLLAPRIIAVTLRDLEVELTGPDSAKAHFVQTYVSPGYGDRVSKTLVLVRQADRWQILEERSSPSPS